MAAIDDTQAEQCGKDWARQVSGRHRQGDGDSVKTDKVDTKATFLAIRDWMNTERNGYNQALPLAARNSWTSREKALALLKIIECEYIEEG